MVKNSAVKWLWKVTGKYKIAITALGFIQVALGLSSVIFALFLRNAVDDAAHGDRKNFIISLILLILLTALQITFRAILRHLEERCRSGIENECKGRLFSCLMGKEHAYVSALHSAEWLSRLISDSAVCANGAVEIIPGVLGMFIKMVAALLMIITLVPETAFIIIPGGIVMIIFTVSFRKILKHLHKKVQEADSSLRVFFQEHLENLMIIRSFSAQKISSDKCNEKMESHKSARMKKNAFSNLCNVGFGVAMNGMYLFGIGFSCFGIISGTVSYGTLMAIMQLIGQIQTPFANITGYLPKFYAMIASAERLMEAENFPDDCPEGVLSDEDIREFYSNKFESIVFSDASFSYADGEQVLNGVNISIEKGKATAFTGHSGCGKSTLLKLMMCLYPLTSGERFITCKDGSRLPLTSRLHRLFAYVPQGNQLMSGTIRDVVTISDENCNETKLWRALDIACASEFVKNLDNGVDYVLGEKGSGLSEGQMQRIAVARAVYSDAPILILDESTSSLDIATEQQLLENIRNMTDKTIVIITHRPAALEICDKIIAMQE